MPGRLRRAARRSPSALKTVQTGSDRQPGPADEILDGRRDQHLTRTRERSDPGAERNGQARNVSRFELNLAGVQARANLEPDRLLTFSDRQSAANSPSRPVERRQKAVSHRLDLGSAMSGELVSHDPAVQARAIRPSGDRPGPRPGQSGRRCHWSPALEFDELGGGNPVGDVSAGIHRLEVISDYVARLPGHAVTTVREGFHGRWRLLQVAVQPDA
jgi:hypothetical protein